MSVYKPIIRGKRHHTYKMNFVCCGVRVARSTGCKNKKDALKVERAERRRIENEIRNGERLNNGADHPTPEQMAKDKTLKRLIAARREINNLIDELTGFS